MKFALLLPCSFLLLACGGGSGSDSSSTTSSGSSSNTIEPNYSVDETSSYTLQATDLYVPRAGISDINFGNFVHAISYADFDLDGDTDIFINTGTTDEVVTAAELYLNDGTGYFERVEDFFDGTPPGQYHARKALTGDFNGDGKPDVFVIGHGYDQPPYPGEAPYVILSGDDGYTLGEGLDEYVGFHHAGASADLDNDGDIDVLVADNDTPTIFINDGDGNFTRTDSLLVGLDGYNWFTAELVDIDGDGYADILASGHEQDDFPSQIVWGNSSGIYRAANATELPEVAKYGTVLDMDVADLDGDGDNDLVLNRTGDGTDGIGFYQGYYVQVLFNDGNGNFTDVSEDVLVTGNSATGGWFDWIRLQDFDADGDIDIVVDDANWNLVWYNDSVGNFQ